MKRVPRMARIFAALGWREAAAEARRNAELFGAPKQHGFELRADPDKLRRNGSRRRKASG